MTKPWGRWWPILTTLTLVVIQIPAVVRTAGDPLQSDFVNYLVPARVVASGGDLSALYESAGFAAALRGTGLHTLGSFVPHPPANALWLLPFAAWSPAEAKVAWTVTLGVALLAAFLCLRCLAPEVDPWLVAVVVLGPALAIRNGLAFGQPYLALLALVAAGVLALEGGRPSLGGFLLGLTVPFKPYAVPMGLALLLVRSTLGGAFPGFVVGMLTPTAALVAFTGTAPLETFLVRVLPWMQRGEIQDPFSPVWGSATALAQHLFRFEVDLNPHPWFDAPRLARFLSALVPASIASLGVFSARRALTEGRARDAVGAALAFAVAASPFAASYHLVLLTIPAFALVARLDGGSRLLAVSFWLLLGSPLLNLVRALAGEESVFAYARFGVILALALWMARPFVSRRSVMASAALGLLAGALAVLTAPRSEVWSRVEAARGYSMSAPRFCGDRLRWLSPSASGRGLESRGEGEDCGARPTGPERVTARFRDGSWNLYWSPEDGGAFRQLTFSGANEYDPVLTPDGCSIIFASDQGRGLGSSALYRLDVSGLNRGCDTAARAVVRP